MESRCQILSVLSDSLLIQLKGANPHELETLVKDTDYRLKLVKWHEKRSLNANAYAWVLISKIAEKVGSSKDEIYDKMLQDYGTIDEEFPPLTIIADADISILKDHFKLFETNMVGDRKFNSYFRIKGSSEMDSKEMARFIDNIVEDAKGFGIETATPDEIQRMKEQWGIEISNSEQ